MAREVPPRAASELDMLIAWLDFQRESICLKLDGLTEEQARWQPAPTANSLLSLAKHLGYVEHWWFGTVFGCEEDIWPRDDNDADFKVGDDDTIESVLATYRRRWAHSNEVARGARSLDETSKIDHPKLSATTLRWILVHMVEETARHAGHADITRELIDGTTGV